MGAIPEKAEVSEKNYATPVEGNFTDKLMPITKDGKLKFGAPCAFINNHGDTIIPFGKYNVFKTDTLVTFTFVKDATNGVVGINRKGEVLFEAFIYGDVQIDHYSEGLIRVKQNNKIGYADKKGNIVIKPKYCCAYPFKNGKAKVTFDCNEMRDEIDAPYSESKTWFYINKEGKEMN